MNAHSVKILSSSLRHLILSNLLRALLLSDRAVRVNQEILQETVVCQSLLPI